MSHAGEKGALGMNARPGLGQSHMHEFVAKGKCRAPFAARTRVHRQALAPKKRSARPWISLAHARTLHRSSRVGLGMMR